MCRLGTGVPWRSLHPKNHPISPSVVTTMGLLVLLLFQTSVDGMVRPSNREKTQSLLHKVEKNWGRLENKAHPNYHEIVHNYHKMPFLYSFATVVISGGAEISDDNHPSTPRLKSSPWRARVARAPKAQAVAMGDLLGNLLKIHQGLWMFMI